MTKPAFLIPIILLILSIPVISPSPSWAAKPIRTTQKTIVIDPGHGGTDPGITLPQGITEKEAALDLSKRIARLLDSRYNVLLTRTADTLLPPVKRTAQANHGRADFFLSLHLHGRKSDQAAIFFFDGPPENPSMPPGSWQNQPLALQTESKRAAAALAKEFQAAQIKASIVPAPVSVLEGTLMPALVMEPFPISILTEPETREAILTRYAEAISKGIDRYLKTQPSNNK